MLMIDGLLSKTVKRGFEFTLMVVGESGLGKSTMINSLFLTELYRNRTLPPVQVRHQQFRSAEDDSQDGNLDPLNFSSYC